jgi:hypothetical protein
MEMDPDSQQSTYRRRMNQDLPMERAVNWWRGEVPHRGYIRELIAAVKELASTLSFQKISEKATELSTKLENRKEQ